MMIWPTVRVACVSMTLCTSILAGATLSDWAVPAGATASGYAWHEFHGDPGLSGTSTDPTISSVNASALGVRWMSDVGSTVGSPVVAWNAALAQRLVYVGDTAGYMNAVNAETGAIVWSVPFASSFTATPLVAGASVWVAPLSDGTRCTSGMNQTGKSFIQVAGSTPAR